MSGHFPIADCKMAPYHLYLNPEPMGKIHMSTSIGEPTGPGTRTSPPSSQKKNPGAPLPLDGFTKSYGNTMEYVAHL